MHRRLRAGLVGPTGDPQPTAAGRLVDTADLRLLDYLLESGSDRIGALDFQPSATDYEPRRVESATLDELASSAAKVDAGDLLSPALDPALLHGRSIGGARPKALLGDGGRRLIAKFSSSTDTYPIVKGEFVAMELARRLGLKVAPVELTTALGKDVLLIDRFDRSPDGARRTMVSALTVPGWTSRRRGTRATRLSRPRSAHASPIRRRRDASSSLGSPSTSSSATATTTPATTPPSGTVNTSPSPPPTTWHPNRVPEARLHRRWRSGMTGTA